jgi:predicted dehydrogenase
MQLLVSPDRRAVRRAGHRRQKKRNRKSSRLRIAFIGHGAVGSVHARRLTNSPGVTLAAVFGPDRELAEAFASSHRVMQVCNTIEEAISHADLAIICSPSPLHYQQAHECLTFGVNTAKLQCAHSSRYLTPYRRITECIQKQTLGAVQQILYLRHMSPRKRDWDDDALLHHSAHPLDLLLYWFGDLVPKGCVVLPRRENPRSVSLLAELPNGAPATISVSYSSRLPQARLFIVGEHHTVETDGFGFLRSDLEQLNLTVAGVETYEQAIGEQDVEFVHACEGGKQSIEWAETIRLLRTLNRFHAFVQS